MGYEPIYPDTRRVNKTHYKLTLILTIISLTILGFYIGHRDIWVGADTAAYIQAYLQTLTCLCRGDRELGFELFSLFIAYFGLSSQMFLSIISIISFMLIITLCHRISSEFSFDNIKQNNYRTPVFLFLVGLILLSPMTSSAQFNGLRQGLSAFALAVFIFEIYRKNYKSAILFSIIAISFHNSSIMYIISVLSFAYIIRSITPFLLLLIMSLLFSMYVSGTSEFLVQYIFPSVYEFVNDYGQHASDRLQSGVRWDFAIFTLVLILISFIILPRSGSKIDAKNWRIFVLTTSTILPFFILGWGYFSNRYLFTTWILLIILIGTISANFLVRRNLIAIAALGMVIMGPAVLLLQFNHAHTEQAQ